MRRAWILLFGLLAWSLTLTTMVHAREVQGVAGLECTGVLHADGDRDQSAGDGDSALPHHHSGCQGQTFYVQATRELARVFVADGPDGLRSADRIAPSRSVDPALRPPAA